MVLRGISNQYRSGGKSLWQRIQISVNLWESEKQLHSNYTCYNSDLECTGSLSATAVSRCSCNLRGAHIHRGCALALLVKYSRSRWAVDNCHTSAIIKCIGIKRDLSIRASTVDLVVYVRWAGDCRCLAINCNSKLHIIIHEIKRV